MIYVSVHGVNNGSPWLCQPDQWDICISSPSCADDITLMSNTKGGLDRMMHYAHMYGRRCRMTLSAIKTSCIVFGEWKVVKRQNMLTRKWAMGNKPVDETDVITHLGIRINAYLETTVGIKEMCKKGKAILFSLTRLGVRPNALNPKTASNIWSKIALPSFTYGCQLWRMNVSNIDNIERTQKYVAKIVQSIPMRTHDEIARGAHWMKYHEIRHQL